MHAGHRTFSLKEITKVEGHANLDVEVEDGRVTNCEFRATESHRFFEGLVLGKHFEEIPLIVSRICGFCSISHLNTAIEACEKALNYKPSDQTLLLRELATNGEFLKSHALHLYMLVLPDYLGRETALEFKGKEKEYLHDALHLKKAGTDIIKLLGARTYQTVNFRVGGFSKLPAQAEIGKALKSLEAEKERAIGAVRLFAGFRDKMDFERETNYVGLVGSNYCLLCGRIVCSDGTVIGEEDYLRHVKEFVVPYSTAREAKFNGMNYMVGALARLNLNQKQLCNDAKALIKELKLRFPSHRIYDNSIAQALELVQCIDASIETLKDMEIRSEPLEKIKPKKCEGVGITEAPRGTLYHQYAMDSQGFVTDANIIVPTSQNTRNLESDLREFIPGLLDLPEEKANLEIEKLVRAYDPCISCATHFLNVKWKKE